MDFIFQKNQLEWLKFLLNQIKFKLWVRDSFRWLPAKEYSNMEQLEIIPFLQLPIDNNTRFNQNSNLKLFYFSLIYLKGNNKKSDKIYFFPISLVIKQNIISKTDMNNIFDEQFKINSGSDNPIFSFILIHSQSDINIDQNNLSFIINLSPVEYDIDFWEKIFMIIFESNRENANQNKLILSLEEEDIKLKFNLEILNESFLKLLINKNIKFKNSFEINPLGGMDTTNVVLKFNNKLNNLSLIDKEKYKTFPFVGKIYKEIHSNLEFNRETFILRELNTLGFNHVPAVYSTINLNYTICDKFKGSQSYYINIIFLEYIYASGDVGGIFWNELNEDNCHNLIKFKELIGVNNLLPNSCISIYNEIFPLSFKYCEIVGNTTKELHSKLLKISQKIISKNYDINPTQFLNKIFDEINKILENVQNKSESNLKFDFIKEFINSLDKNLIIKISCENLQLIHQDLHLQQMLILSETAYNNSDLNNREPIILDFEGDPQMNLDQRFQFQSIFMDLASLIRSFNYIKYFTLTSLIETILKSHECHLNNFINDKFKELYKIFNILINADNLNNFKNWDTRKIPKNTINNFLLVFLKIFYLLVYEKNKNYFKNSSLISFFLTMFQSNYKPYLSNDLYNFIQRLIKIVNDQNNSFDLIFSELISYFKIDKSQISILEEFFKIMESINLWEQISIGKIIEIYFNSTKFNYTKFKKEIFIVLFFYALRRNLMELKYEIFYRPFNLIIPVLGLIDIINNINALKIDLQNN